MDWLPLNAPDWDPAHNPGMCPDWESNLWPFGLQAGTQSSEPHQPGLILYFLILFLKERSEIKYPVVWCAILVFNAVSLLVELPCFQTFFSES